MCVIAIKPNNVRISRNTVELMYTANPHGAGLSIVGESNTIVSKGYFDIESLWRDVNSLQNCELVLHFRWATHGGISAEMTHPFLVSEEEKEATSVYSETSLPVFFHNGVIHGYGTEHVSDTCDFAVNVLAKLGSVSAMTRLLTHISSSFVLIHNKEVLPVGHFEDYKGLLVSNTHFDWDHDYGNELLTREVSNSGKSRKKRDTFLSESTDCFNGLFEELRTGNSSKKSKPKTLKPVSKRKEKHSKSI